MVPGGVQHQLLTNPMRSRMKAVPCSLLRTKVTMQDGKKLITYQDQVIVLGEDMRHIWQEHRKNARKARREAKHNG